MATNIPPHNLGEIVDGLVLLIENPDTTIDELIQVIPGPDFPTAGFIYGREGIVEAYRTGRGRIVMRADADIETDEKSGRDRIVIPRSRIW
jgi:DNA gyrase subunit A